MFDGEAKVNSCFCTTYGLLKMPSDVKNGSIFLGLPLFLTTEEVLSPFI